MKFKNGILAAALVTSLTVSATFATPSLANVELSAQTGTKQVAEVCREQRDPIKALEAKKERVQAKFKAGKITKQEADEAIAKIDAKIKKVEEFNQLKPDQKKEWLINHFTEKINQKVSDGKLSKEEGQKLIERVTEKVQEWDGEGYPNLGKHKRR